MLDKGVHDWMTGDKGQPWEVGAGFLGWWWLESALTKGPLEWVHG